MVDKGFLVDDLVPCKIYRPAILSGRSSRLLRKPSFPEGVNRCGLGMRI